MPADRGWKRLLIALIAGAAVGVLIGALGLSLGQAPRGAVATGFILGALTYTACYL